MKNTFIVSITICFLICLSVGMQSQSLQKIDSLENQLKNVTKKEKVGILNSLSWEYRNSKIHESIKYGLQAILIASQINDSIGLSQAYSFTGVAYRNLGNYVEALDYYYKGLRLSQEKKMHEQLGYAYINIGNLYIYQQLYKDAHFYLSKALKISDSLQNKKMLAYCHLNLARVDIQLENFNEALMHLDTSLKLRSETGNVNGQAVCHKYSGDVYIRQKKYMNALESYFTSLDLAKNSGDIDLFANNYNTIAKVYVEMKDYKNAELYAEKSLQSSLYINSKLRSRNAYITLAEIKKQRKQYKKAYDYAELILKYNDSLYSLQINEKISYIKFSEKQHAYEQRLKDRFYEYKLEIQKQKRSRDISIILAFLFIILSIILFVFFRNKRKINSVLSEKNFKLKESKNEIEKYHKNIQDSIDYAKGIQNSIFPSDELLQSYFSDYFILFRPKDKVSGDFYWWTVLDEHVIVSAADCTGHGVPGAFMSMLGLTYLREIVNKGKITDPSLILKNLRNEFINTLQDNLDEGMDIALFSFNTKSNKLLFSGANNPMYLIRKGRIESSDNQIKELMRSKSDEYGLYEFTADLMPIANYIKMDIFENTEVICQKGDFIYMFSDGFTDQLGGSKNTKFKFNRFQSLLLQNIDKPASEQKKVLNETFDLWKGKNKQLDDVVIIGMKI